MDATVKCPFTWVSGDGRETGRQGTQGHLWARQDMRDGQVPGQRLLSGSVAGLPRCPGLSPSRVTRPLSRLSRRVTRARPHPSQEKQPRSPRGVSRCRASSHCLAVPGSATSEGRQWGGSLPGGDLARPLRAQGLLPTSQKAAGGGGTAAGDKPLRGQQPPWRARGRRAAGTGWAQTLAFPRKSCPPSRQL